MSRGKQTFKYETFQMDAAEYETASKPATPASYLPPPNQQNNPISHCKHQGSVGTDCTTVTVGF